MNIISHPNNYPLKLTSMNNNLNPLWLDLYRQGTVAIRQKQYELERQNKALLAVIELKKEQS